MPTAHTVQPRVPKIIPGSICFDAELLSVPTFAEVGVPPWLGELGEIKPLVGIGDWVDRGDVLLAAKYAVYSSQSPPRFPWSLFPDPQWHMEMELKSPVAGLVVDLRKATVGEQKWGKTYYMPTDLLPVILLPRDEPPQDTWQLTFFHHIGSLLKEHWRMVPFCHVEKGHVRLGEILPELKSPEWKTALDAISKFESLALDKFHVRHMTLDDAALVDTIQRLRARSLVFRDKLVHLTK